MDFHRTSNEVYQNFVFSSLVFCYYFANESYKLKCRLIHVYCSRLCNDNHERSKYFLYVYTALAQKCI